MEGAFQGMLFLYPCADTPMQGGVFQGQTSHVNTVDREPTHGGDHNKL